MIMYVALQGGAAVKSTPDGAGQPARVHAARRARAAQEARAAAQAAAQEPQGNRLQEATHTTAPG